MNIYQSGAQKCIPSVLVYAHFENQFLMVQKKGGINDGLVNGLGGKFEANESPQDCAQREFQEEANIIISKERFQWKGVIHFPDFIPSRKEDWVVYLFTVELTQDELLEVPQSNDEGSLNWLSYGQITQSKLWSGDKLFIDSVLLKQEVVLGTIWYENGSAIRDELMRLPIHSLGH